MTRLALVFLLTAGSAQAQSVEQRLDDLRLAAAVRLALVADPSTRALDVEVVAEGGAVRLSGRSAASAARVAQGVPGVRSVDGIALGTQSPSEPPSGSPSESPVTTPAERPDRPAEAPRGGWGSAPDAPPAAPRAEVPVSHTVARGDTLFSLARQYRTTVEALRALNGLGPRDGIELGRRLRVR